ncbi:MAG: 50S ribosomal protein L4 [Phycisphaerales bacterium]
MEIAVYNTSGASVGSLTIDPEMLGGEINPALIKQAYVMYHANLRQGSARTKSRGMVEGSTRKLFRQKGTGNARVGSARTNIRKGGGRAFAKTKTREDYRLDMPVKMRRKANRNALLAKLFGGVVDGKKIEEVKVIDDLSMSAPKTSEFRKVLEALGIDRSCLVALNPENINARLSARNIEDVTVCSAEQLTAFELMNHRYLVIAKSDLEAWIERSGGYAKSGKNRESAKKAASAAGEGS